MDAEETAREPRRAPPITFDAIRPLVREEGIPSKDVDFIVSQVVYQVRKILNKKPGEP